MDTNTISKAGPPIGGAVGGGMIMGSDDDLLKIIGIVISALSVIWPIVQSMRAKKGRS